MLFRSSTPDGTCEDCELIAAGEHPDVYELDAASRTGVENVREEIIGRVQFAPTRGKRKIYIIDEVHMLSTAAFNALLKTLEEPPSHVVFILCTTDPQKVPETIHSRCQRFDFRRIAHEAIVSRLGAVCMAEGVEFEGEALDLVAHRAEGGMRNALTALEQLIAYEGGKVTLEGAESLLGSIASSDMVRILQAIGTRDAVACFTWVADFLETGSDLAQFVRDLAERVRDLYVLSLAGESVSLEINEETRQELVSVLPLFGADRLTFLLGVLGDTIADLKTSTNPRLSFEIALTRMIRPQTDLSLEALAARIEALEASQAAMPVHAIPDKAVPTQRAAADAGLSVEKKMTAIKQDIKSDAAASDSTAVTFAVGVKEEQGAPQAIAVTSEDSGQPAAAPSGTPAKQGAYDLTNPAALQRFWQAALALIKKEKAAYHVLLLNTKLTYDAQTASLTIGFPAESEFAFKAFQKPEASSVVEKAIAQAYSAPLAFSYMQLPKVTSRGVASPASQTAAGSVAAPVRADSAIHNDSAVAKMVSSENPVQNASMDSAGSMNSPAYEEVSAFDDDVVPLDAYEEWSPNLAREEDVVSQQVGESEDSSQKELSDLKDALSLFGDGVMIEQWN